MANVRNPKILTKILAFFTFLFVLFGAIVTFHDVRRPWSSSSSFPVVLLNRTEPSTDDFLRVEFNVSSITAKCRNDDFLLFYILSTSKNFARRKNLRSTWASKLDGICFVFIVGRAANNSQIQIDLNVEQEKFRDLVQINHVENYQNVIYKEIGALLWSARFYRNISFLFKSDDDLIVDSILISSMAKFLVTKKNESVNYISKYRRALLDQLTKADRPSFFRGGWEMVGQPTQHNDEKFGVDRKIWSEKLLPPYCSGFGWMMSSTVRDQLVAAAKIYPREKIVWIGDVFLSGFIARAAQVRCIELSIDYEQIDKPQCPCLFFQNPMLTVCSSSMHAGQPTPADPHAQKEFNDSWKVIRQRHLTPTTNRTIAFLPNC